MKNDMGNNHSPTIIIVPITAKENKTKLTTQIHIDDSNSGLPYKSIALLEQIRTIDKNRILSYIGKVSNDTIKQVGTALLMSLEIKV